MHLAREVLAVVAEAQVGDVGSVVRLVLDARGHDVAQRDRVYYPDLGFTNPDAVAASSTRAREGAPVAVPVDWDELDRLSGATHFNVAEVPLRVLGRLRLAPGALRGHAVFRRGAPLEVGTEQPIL